MPITDRPNPPESPDAGDAQLKRREMENLSAWEWRSLRRVVGLLTQEAQELSGPQADVEGNSGIVLDTYEDLIEFFAHHFPGVSAVLLAGRSLGDPPVGAGEELDDRSSPVQPGRGPRITQRRDQRRAGSALAPPSVRP